MGNTNSNERRRPEISYEDKCKLESGKPVNFQGGVSIRFNPQTGKLEGMPEEWVKGYDLPVPVDESKMVRTKHFYRFCN
jgi:hypothetical protein